MITNSDVRDIRDHLQGLIEDIYKTGNIPDLEFHLENVMVYFGLKLPKTDPVIFKLTEDEFSDNIHPMKKIFDIEVWKNHSLNIIKKTASN